MDAEDLDIRVERFNVNGDAGKQSAASDGNEDRVNIAVGVLSLTNNFHSDGALAGNHIRIIEGRYGSQAFFCLKFFCVSSCVAKGLAEENDFAA